MNLSLIPIFFSKSSYWNLPGVDNLDECLIFIHVMLTEEMMGLIYSNEQTLSFVLFLYYLFLRINEANCGEYDAVSKSSKVVIIWRLRITLGYRIPLWYAGSHHDFFPWLLSQSYSFSHLIKFHLRLHITQQKTNIFYVLQNSSQILSVHYVNWVPCNDQLSLCVLYLTNRTWQYFNPAQDLHTQQSCRLSLFVQQMYIPLCTR